MTARERFLAKVRVDGEHWIWTGVTTSNGRYGRFWHGGRMTPAHRAAHKLFKGPIPEGHEVDHGCRITLCVNPACLEAVTGVENRKRQGAAKTTCPKGHTLDGVRKNHRANGVTYVSRYCLQCNRDRAAKRRAARIITA